MNAEEIGKMIDPNFPSVYAPTYAPTTLFFRDGTIKAGYFQNTDESEELQKKNIFTFIEFGENAQGYRATAEKKYITKINGDDLVRVQHPRAILVTYEQVFNVNPNNTITPKMPVKIGGVTMGPGVSFGSGVIIGGLNLFDFKSKRIRGYIDNGVFVVNGFSS